MRISDWSSDVSSSYLRRVVVRRNSVTGRLYADDPAILSWQLANEPRPGGSDAMISRTADAYYDWIEANAKVIRGRDRSEERRAGKGWVSTVSSRVVPLH